MSITTVLNEQIRKKLEKIREYELKKQQLKQEIIQIQKERYQWEFEVNNNLIPELKKFISKKHKIWVDEILTKKRNKVFMNAKKEFCFILYIKYWYTFERIAELFWYNHSAIIYLVDTYDPDQS